MMEWKRGAGPGIEWKRMGWPRIRQEDLKTRETGRKRTRCCRQRFGERDARGMWQWC